MPHERPLRSVAPPAPAHRRRAHRALQLAGGPRHERPRRSCPAHRGHRPGALDPRERRADPRRAALAGARLGRGPDQPGRARRRHAEVARSSCSTAGTPTAPPRRATTSRPTRSEHGADRGYRGTDEGEGAVRLRVPDDGETRRATTSSAATRRSSNVHLDDPVIARADGSAALQLRGRRRRPRRGDHARGPRRGPPLQHAQAAAGPRRRWAPSRRSSRTCRCCTAPTARSSPSATARRRCRSCATPATCPRRCATTSRCWAGAPPTTRRSSRPRSWSSGSTIERVSQNPARFDEQKLRWMNGRYLRELSIDELTARLEALHRPRRPARRRGDLAARRSQTLADFWPLAGFIFDGPADDADAREKWLDEDGRGALAAAREALAGARPVRRRGRSRWRCARSSSARRPSRRTSSSRCASRWPERRCRRGSSRRSRCSGSDESLERIDARRCRP